MRRLLSREALVNNRVSVSRTSAPSGLIAQGSLCTSRTSRPYTGTLP